MRLLQLQFFYFKLDIDSSFQEKEGIAIFAKTSAGTSAWSEVSPLPGYSKESLLDALEQLYALKQEVLSFSLKEILLLIQEKPLFPSVLFGLESLLYTLLKPYYPSFKQLPLCALLLGSFQDIQMQIPRILQEGYLHVKLKISQLSFKEAHCIIKQLQHKVRLKIDLNQAWDLSTSLSFFHRYEKDAFEYIEEPVSSTEDLPFFPYPIALDETSRELSKLPYIPTLKAIIIKPMLVGGIKQIQLCLKNAPANAQIIFSSSYESGIGLFHLCALYERLCIPIHPLGVDTYRMIKQDLLVTPHTHAKGMLRLNPLEIDPNRLKELDSCLTF